MRYCGSLMRSFNAFELIHLDRLDRDLPRPSAMITKRKGDKGSPFRIPLDGKNGFKGPPFSMTEKNSPETNSIIQFIQIRLKPKVWRISLMYVQLIFSKALDRSS